MVWQYNVPTIVMVTRLEERVGNGQCLSVCVSVLVTLSPPLPPVPQGVVKCNQYWPESVNIPCLYGDIKVTMTEEEELAVYCVRKFSVQEVSHARLKGYSIAPPPPQQPHPHPCSMGTKTPHVTSSSSTSWRGLTTECPTTPRTSSPSTSVSATTTAAAPPPAPWWSTAVQGWDGPAPLSPWIPAFR